MCCVCQRIEEKRAWRYVPIKENEQLTHGYCPECFQAVMLELQALVVLKYKGNNKAMKSGKVQQQRGLGRGDACA
jgi:hypothetical protein